MTAPRSPGPTGTTSRPAGTPSAPSSVEIASIGLSEALAPTGLAADGSLEVPADPGQVAWFSGGGRPGGAGPTVVLGHVDSTTGPAVFARLTELVPGDVVTVGSDDGASTRYVVDRVQDVPQDRFPTEAVFGATPDDELRLITCTGPYDRVSGYRDNRVVWASAEG
ncbi:Sortase family protein [Auraticoccus monumenti]|uniref:Sortase family protein n=1 Tax=Auraticoccus monumenti TaxID=675864 RepID=A0A1G6XJJ4_9ACTN|nr:Sortase family protein [Auraticoccus monumenti]